MTDRRTDQAGRPAIHRRRADVPARPGCTFLPYVANREMSQPDRLPFSDQELALNPMKRNLWDLE
jgi:hypothetical protein